MNTLSTPFESVYHRGSSPAHTDRCHPRRTLADCAGLLCLIVEEVSLLTRLGHACVNAGLLQKDDKATELLDPNHDAGLERWRIERVEVNVSWELACLNMIITTVEWCDVRDPFPDLVRSGRVAVNVAAADFRREVELLGCLL